ncbi:MAG TPA: Holliday junction resolvase RuvX, partial [Candidatus Atribacteria bacterium]|nr:Holliday junction resolvase RuvX [Candidatus Atribacteria bacterium]
VDERLTSRLAQDIIKNTEDKRFAKKKHKDAKDQVAAQIILQTWFDETNE